MKTSPVRKLGWAGVLLAGCLVANGTMSDRLTVSLNGDWELAESVGADAPGVFERTVPVPGLVDLAEPGLAATGVESAQRNYFWYRTTFDTPDEAFRRAQLRIHKAKYGSKVWLNGRLVDEHDFNFSAGEFELAEHLKPAGETNGLLVQVAAHPSLQPDHIVWGHDFEKNKHIPGIYDDVEIVFTGRHRFDSVQLAPSWQRRNVLVDVDVFGHSPSSPIQVDYRVTEAATAKVIAEGHESLDPAGQSFEIPMPKGRPWSPEDPFLYEIELSIDGDSWSHRFGLRDFAFNADTGFAELNGGTYFLRGTNICLFRFFEDSQRGSKPWDREWVQLLFQRMKDMQWNSFRFCLGPAPRWWYDICDEVGLLVQDEFPIWYGAEAETYPEAFMADALVPQYTDWMRERWNHTSIVIWDAQNESVTPETGAAIQRVRGLDLTDRPWDNGYSPPQRPDDPVEAHPYVLQNFLGRDPGPQGPLYEFMRERRIPDNGPSELSPPADGGRYPNPIINNENVFFWITREGQPTALTRWIFNRLYPEDSPPEVYYEAYGYKYHRLISYWRVHRTSAAVQEFCVLGYSRGIEEQGYTADNFVDLENLTFKPFYHDYAYAAFFPVGLLIDRWEEIHAPGAAVDIPILMCNDFPAPWSGEITFKLINAEGEVAGRQVVPARLPALGTADFVVSQQLPMVEGAYRIEATFTHEGEVIRFEYHFSVGEVPDMETDPADDSSNDQFIHEQDDGLIEADA